MNETLEKVLKYLVFPLIIIAMVWGLWSSIQKPVKFNDAKDARSTVAIQRLKDIRTLQVAFKSVNGKYASTIDSLILFYNTGKMDVILQVGSHDDSLAVVYTDKLKKAIKAANRKATEADIQQKLYDTYLREKAAIEAKYEGKSDEELEHALNSNLHIIAAVTTQIPVKDTLFLKRPDFVPDSLKYIPFSGKQEVQMESEVRKVSGVDVPLFEARMPYKALLKGLDNQLRINLDDQRKKSNLYEGLMVGSVTIPNNNAGNWE